METINDIIELFEILTGTPIPALLFLLGAVLMILSFLGRVGNVIELDNRRQVVVGIFGILCMCSSVMLYIISSMTNASSDGLQMPQFITTPVPQILATPSLPTSGVSANSNIGLCYGKCWQYDQSNRTMTWVGPLDGTEDIWQGDETSLSRIRSGWIAIIGPLDVPGEIEACVLTLNGQTVTSSCNGEQHLYQVSADSLYQITSESLDFGGFRWKPALGYGYRLP